MPDNADDIFLQVDKLLRAIHFLFHNVPARRQDYQEFTDSSKFGLPFCGHRWVENLPVVERAIEIWPNTVTYVEAVSSKKLPNPNTASFDVVNTAVKDKLVPAKLHFLWHWHVSLFPS